MQAEFHKRYAPCMSQIPPIQPAQYTSCVVTAWLKDSLKEKGEAACGMSHTLI